MCLPAEDTAYKEISSAININEVQEIASDLRNTWQVIIGSAFLAIIIG